MMYQCWFLDCSKRTSLVQDADSRRGCEGKVGSKWELSVLPTQFYCEPKSALKNKVNLKEKKNK